MTDEMFKKEKAKIDRKVSNLDLGNYDIEDYFRLVKKARKVNTKLRDIRLGKERSEEIIEQLEDHPRTAMMSNEDFAMLMELNVGVGAILSLYIAHKANPQIIEEIANGNIMPLLAGVTGGAIVSAMENYMYNTRAVSNLVEDIRLKHNKKKLANLQQKEALEKYHLEGIEDKIENLLSVQFDMDQLDK